MLERNIYICHAHQNKQDVSEASLKWMNSFIDYLETFLKRISGTSYNIFYSGMSELDIYGCINKSNVFIFILESDSLQSSIFSEEVRIIQENYLKNPQNTQLFKILTTSISEDSQPSFLSNISGYNFYDTDTTPDFRITRKKEEINTSKIIWGKLADVAYRIKNFDVTNKKSNPEETAKLTVYLAETTADQSNNREIIKRELEQFGFRVVPDHQLPVEGVEFKKAVEDYLAKSDMSIHVIGQDYGEIPEGEVYSIVDLQNKIAAHFAKSQNEVVAHFSRLIWILPDLTNTTEIQKRYINKLKRNGENLFRTEIIQTPLESFKSLLIKRLKSISFDKTIKIDQQESKVKLYIIHERNDLIKVQDIAEWLKNNNIDPMLSHFSENDIGNYRQNLVNCNAVIIYNSGNSPAWLKSKIFDLVKAPGYGRKKPFAAKAIFMALNANGLDVNLLDGFIILNYHANIAIALQPLFDKLKQINEGNHVTNPAL